MRKSTKVITLTVIGTAVIGGTAAYLMSDDLNNQDDWTNGQSGTNSTQTRSHGGVIFIPGLGGRGGYSGGGTTSSPSVRGGFGGTGSTGSAGVSS